MLFIWETRKMLIIGTSLEILSLHLNETPLPKCNKKQLYHERIHNHIYEKIKDQFEDPDYIFIK